MAISDVITAIQAGLPALSLPILPEKSPGWSSGAHVTDEHHAAALSVELATSAACKTAIRVHLRVNALPPLSRSSSKLPFIRPKPVA